jgi:ectoine hydroxylase-related dioxygenase (phytanoyl-CoA dioxygenase family)
MKLEQDGWCRIDSGVGDDLRELLRHEAFSPDRAGARCLLDLPAVHAAAMAIRQRLVGRSLLPPSGVAIQAIAFDKTPCTNWKVPWHQDLMFPLACPADSDGYEAASKKDGVDYARPPAGVLARLLAARLHLDDCGPENGPLRVSPGTHLAGIIPSTLAAGIASARGGIPCLAREGEVILMRPLLLHASSRAGVPGHRRVLHFVFHDGSEVPVPWHRSVGPGK